MRRPDPVPVFAIPGDVRTWETRRFEIRGRLWNLLGFDPPPANVPVVRTLVREDRGSYLFEKFQFENGTGDSVPGYLLLPKQRGTLPAVFYCHWHGDEYEIGKEEIFRSDHTPEVPAEALTQRGYAVMAIDACCFGERNGQGPGGDIGPAGELSASKWNLWFGRTLWGSMVQDDLLALRYLMSRPEIDPDRIAVTGISMGSTRSWWLMALEDRVRTAVAVGCLTRYQDLIQAGGLRYHGIYYYVPGILRHFDTEAVIALIAPRPILFLTGDQDPGSPVEGIRKIDELARPAWRLYGSAAGFQNIVYPATGHQYLPEMWKRMLQWIERHLQPGAAGERYGTHH